MPVRNTATVRNLTISAGLAAFSAVIQLIHIGYQSPQWGMWIDLVAISWIVAVLLFNIKTAFSVSLLGALIITLFAPDTWLGASMKWIASVPMCISLDLWLRIMHKNQRYYDKPLRLIIPVLTGLFLRILFVLPLNYLYAIPLWTGMSTAKAWSTIPWFVIVTFNIVQGILDVGVAWIIVYRFKLSRFASWVT